MDVKERIRKYINEHKTGVIIASIFGSGFVSGMIFHKIVGPKYVPASGSITLLAENISGESLIALNKAFESISEQGYKICKHV